MTQSRFLRSAGAMLAITASVGLTGCFGPSIPVVSRDAISTTDAALALRLSPGLYVGGWNNDGYLVLVDHEGTGRALKIGAVAPARVLWNEAGIYVGGPAEEFLVTTEGVTVFERSPDAPVYSEYTRFLSDDGLGFISVYNRGMEGGGYASTVVVGSANGIEVRDTHGYFDILAKCESRIVGASDVQDLPDPPPFIPGSDHRTDALVIVYPASDSGAGADLHTLSFRESDFGAHAIPAPCVDDRIYLLAPQRENPEQSETWDPVMRVWDVNTGEHRVLPLLLEGGKPTDWETLSVGRFLGPIVGDHLMWLDDGGRVWQTNIHTGETKTRFTVELAVPRGVENLVHFTDRSVFVLDSGAGGGQPAKLSRYDLETAARQDLLEIAGTESLRKNGRTFLWSMALNPEWIAELEGR